MAKKKVKQSKQENFPPDLGLLEHKYSDYYNGFVMYDKRIITYPIYKTKVLYLATRMQELHPIILGILKIIKYLQKIKMDNSYRMLARITQMDKNILDGILSEFNTKGYLKQEMGLVLTTKGEEALQKEKEKVVEERTAYIAFDGVHGTILGVVGNQKDISLDYKKGKDTIELRSKFKARPRTENLDDEFEGEKTLRQSIVEVLKLCEENRDRDIDEILSVDPSKFFKKCFCLFYKNAEEEEKILVINEKYELDNRDTKLFDRLITEQSFMDNVDQNTSAFKENKQEFERATPELIEQTLGDDVVLANGKTLEVMEHKKYFKHILNNAKKEIFIQSPWIRKDILDIYKNDMQSAIGRGVKIKVKYGMKPRNKFGRVGIDNDSAEFFNSLDKKFFQLIKGNDHSKIIICDDDFMIIGSFNWLSFGGGKDDNEVRGETSTINTNKDEIKKQKERFVSERLH